jgi:hypothetical protein
LVMQELFNERLVRETPNPAVSALRHAFRLVTTALLPLLYFRLLPAATLRWATPLWFVAFFGVALLAKASAKRPRRSLVDVQIDDDGIHVDGRLSIRREHIRSGAMITTASSHLPVPASPSRICNIRKAISPSLLGSKH